MRQVAFLGGGLSRHCGVTVSVIVSVTIGPQFRHTQRNRMQSCHKPIPRFPRGVRARPAGFGHPPILALVGLENCCPGNGTVGSIPTLSAKPSLLVPTASQARLSGSFGLSCSFGSKNERNQINKMNKTNQIDQTDQTDQINPSRLSSAPSPSTLV